MNYSTREISCAENVFALVAFGSRTPPFARLMFSAFEDGTLIWSADRTIGGSPYFTFNVGDARVASVLDRLERDGLFTELPIVGGGVPSSECACFIVRKGNSVFEYESAHEFFEEPGKCVAEQDFISGLGDRHRLTVLHRQPPDYLFSRMIWLELRRLIESLIPADAQPCSGELEMLHAEFRWQPSAGEDAEP